MRKLIALIFTASLLATSVAQAQWVKSYKAHGGGAAAYAEAQ